MSDSHTIKLNNFDCLSEDIIALHLDYRLKSRIKPYHMAIAAKLVRCAPMIGDVALVANIGEHTVSADIAQGDDSNGDYLVLIVRSGIKCTVMYTRSKQVNVKHLRVDSIVRVK